MHRIHLTHRSQLEILEMHMLIHLKHIFISKRGVFGNAAARYVETQIWE